VVSSETVNTFKTVKFWSKQQVQGCVKYVRDFEKPLVKALRYLLTGA